MPEVNVEEIKFGIKQVIAVIAVLVTVLTSGAATYYGISSRIQRVDAVIQQQTDQIRTLTDSNDALKRQLLELTITLRTKDIIK